MKKSFIVVLVSVALCPFDLASPPGQVQPVEVTNFPETQTVEVSNMPECATPMFEFVGITTATFNGAGTRVAMNAACANEFPGSRMAYTDEYAETMNPSSVSEAAWIQARPTILVDAATGIDRAGNWFSTASAPAHGFDCLAWRLSSDSVKGAVVEPSGAIGFRQCDFSQPVACAAPVE